MAPKSLICIGLAVMSRIVQVDSIPARGSKGRGRGYRDAVGGVAAEAATAACFLGCDVKFLSAVGDDGVGREIVAGLAAAGVDVEGIVVVPEVSSMTEAVLVDIEGRQAVASYEDDRLQIRVVMPKIASIGGSKVVLADMSWMTGAEHALAAARSAGNITVVVAEMRARNDLARICRIADHVVLGGTALATFNDVIDADEALAAARQNFGVGTLVAFNAAEVVVLYGGRLERFPCPAPRFQRISTAVGIFSGAYALALSEGQAPLASARFAGAVVASRHGFADEFRYPTRADVEGFLSAG